jgi:hypothetical protein
VNLLDVTVAGSPGAGRFLVAGRRRKVVANAATTWTLD